MGIDKRGIAAPCVLLVSIRFYLYGICLGGLLSCLPELGSLLLTPCVSLVVVGTPVVCRDCHKTLRISENSYGLVMGERVFEGKACCHEFGPAR